MDLNKYFQNSEYKDVMRSEIHIAEYNPRILDDEGKKYLKRSIKTFGVLGGIVINKRTGGTVVSGNQKVAVLDSMNKYNADTKENDYKLVVQVIDVDLKTEKEANIAMNSTRAQGYYDDEKLKDLLSDNSIDYKEALLTDEDLSLIGVDYQFKTEGEDSLAADLDALMEPVDNQRKQQKEERKAEREQQRAAIEQAQATANAQQEADYEARKQHMKDVKQAVADAGVEKAMQAEAYVMLSFDNMENKASFMRKFGLPETDKFVKGELIDKQIEV